MLDQYLCVTIQVLVLILHVTPLNCSYSETLADVLKCVNLQRPIYTLKQRILLFHSLQI